MSQPPICLPIGIVMLGLLGAMFFLWVGEIPNAEEIGNLQCTPGTDRKAYDKALGDDRKVFEVRRRAWLAAVCTVIGLCLIGSFAVAIYAPGLASEIFGGS